MEHAAEAGPPWAIAIEQGAIGRAMREGIWLFPAVETLHILGFALLVGSILVYDGQVVRGLGAAELDGWGRRILPYATAGFVLAAAMGSLLFTTEATAYVRNPAFQAKLALVALALANVAFVRFWGRRRRRGLRAAAALSALLWSAVLVCGRLIAYV